MNYEPTEITRIWWFTKVFIGFFHHLPMSPDAKRMGMQPNLAVPGRPSPKKADPIYGGKILFASQYLQQKWWIIPHFFHVISLIQLPKSHHFGWILKKSPRPMSNPGVVLKPLVKHGDSDIVTWPEVFHFPTFQGLLSRCGAFFSPTFSPGEQTGKATRIYIEKDTHQLYIYILYIYKKNIHKEKTMGDSLSQYPPWN